jgi:hypothetical protein
MEKHALTGSQKPFQGVFSCYFYAAAAIRS